MKKIILFLCIFMGFFHNFNHVNANRYNSTNDIPFTTSSPVAGSCGGGGCQLESVPNISAVCPGDNIKDDGSVGDSKSAVQLITGGTLFNGKNINETSYQTIGVPDSGTMDCYSWDGTNAITSITGLGSDLDGQYISVPTGGNQDFSLSVGGLGGAPISEITGYFEKYNVPSGEANIELNGELVSSPTGNFIKNISGVDNDRQMNNYRIYNFKVTQISDLAQNVKTVGLPTYTYYVYAGNINTSNTIINATSLSDGSAVADGTDKTITLNLRDEFNNAVIPVYKADNTPLREIEFHLDYSNNLLLNQHDLTSTDSAVFLNINNGGEKTIELATSGTGIYTENNKGENTGIYNLNFNVYTPTISAYSKAIGSFKINNLGVGVSDITGDYSFISNFDFNFKPLYFTTITGDLLDYGFIEGVSQVGSIDITKESSSIDGGNRKVYVEFGSGTLNNESSSLNMSATGTVLGNVVEGNINAKAIPSTFIPANNFNSGDSFAINTFTSLDGGYLSDLKYAYFSTHISYWLNGKNIIYNSDVIGKGNYWGNIVEGDITQMGLKIYGQSQSQNQQNIIENQGQQDIHLIGKNDKLIIKNELRKKSFQMVKTVTPDNGGGKINNLDFSNDEDGREIDNGNVLYFGELPESDYTIELGNGSDEIISGIKTILIIGGNLYIKENIIYNNKGNDILGIVVLKDENGRGGNIYIDPSVTQVDGTMFADKSLISYDVNFDNGDTDTTSSHEIDGNATQYLLRNQLYILGSLFSENTIGASRKNPPTCPYYVTEICDIKRAQRYDLNYLRRYFLIGGTPANSGVQVFNTDPNNKYPVIIEYNSKIQSTPPPLFEQ